MNVPTVEETAAGGRRPPNDSGTSAGESGRRQSRLQAVTERPLFVVSSALLVLLVIFTAVDGADFIGVTNVRNMALASGVNLILAVGITFVIITAGFDLSVGSVLVFSGVVSVKVMTAVGGQGWSTALIGLAVALVSGVIWGAANGVLVAFAQLNPIIVTLGSLGAALGLAQVIAGGQDLNEIPSVMPPFGIGRIAGIPWLVVVALIVALIAGISLRYTVFGRRTYAIGSSSEASTRAGIRVGRHLTAVYALSGVLAGLAGWLSLAVYGTTNLAGHSLDNLNAATAALLGGVSLYGGGGKDTRDNPRNCDPRRFGYRSGNCWTAVVLATGGHGRRARRRCIHRQTTAGRTGATFATNDAEEFATRPINYDRNG